MRTVDDNITLNCSFKAKIDNAEYSFPIILENSGELTTKEVTFSRTNGSTLLYLYLIYKIVNQPNTTQNYTKVQIKGSNILFNLPKFLNKTKNIPFAFNTACIKSILIKDKSINNLIINRIKNKETPSSYFYIEAYVGDTSVTVGESELRSGVYIWDNQYFTLVIDTDILGTDIDATDLGLKVDIATLYDNTELYNELKTYREETNTRLAVLETTVNDIIYNKDFNVRTSGGETITEEIHIKNDNYYIEWNDATAVTVTDILLFTFFNAQGTEITRLNISKSTPTKLITNDIVESFKVYVAKEYVSQAGTINITIKGENIGTRIENIENKISNIPSDWNGKSIVWYGTSIPAGQDSLMEHSYPILLAKKLGATMYNEAKSESGIASRFLSNGSSISSDWKTCIIHLGNTCANNLDIIHDMYTFDDESRTVAFGPRSKYTGDYPVSLDYDTARATREKYVAMSYQIKIVARYLLSDPVEHEEYLRSIFGDDYDSLVAYNNGEGYAYRGDIDCFVFDHGCNDGRGWTTKSINTYDTTTPVGAMEMMFKLILKYKPKAKIIIVTHYDNYTLTEKQADGVTPYLLGDVFQKIASRWQFNLIKTYELLPFRRGQYTDDQNVPKILTRGYWDNNQIWHDDGFEWSENGDDFTTNMILGLGGSPLSGCTTVSEAKEKINPQMIDGKWYWEAYPNQVWMCDNIHPTSDRSWKCSEYYTNTMLGVFINIGLDI